MTPHQEGFDFSINGFYCDSAADFNVCAVFSRHERNTFERLMYKIAGEHVSGQAEKTGREKTSAAKAPHMSQHDKNETGRQKVSLKRMSHTQRTERHIQRHGNGSFPAIHGKYFTRESVRISR